MVTLRLSEADKSNLLNGWQVDVHLGYDLKGKPIYGYLYENDFGDIEFGGKRFSINYYAPNDEDFKIE